MIDADELRARLRLTAAEGLGAHSLRRLLAALPSPQAVLDAGPQVWREIAGAKAAQGLAASAAAADALCERTLAWLAQAPQQRQVLALGDAQYPPALLHGADPPALLYAQGRLEVLSAPAIAIVGSRNATPQGIDNAHQFAAYLSQAGFVIISGLAQGIDGAAHEGALQGPGGTLAVVGTGLDRVYPARHAALARRIAENGLLLSDFALGTPALAGNFPRRNRLIAALALGTLVVEATLKSGSLITARLAAECGREVFAMPGSIHAPQSKGCHQLIRQGAKLVETAQDILDELRLPPVLSQPAAALAGQRPERVAMTDEPAPGQTAADPLLAALGHDPASLDALQARTGWPAAELNARLLTLELDGRVARLPGGLFQRRGAA